MFSVICKYFHCPLPVAATYGPDQFSDLTMAEFKAQQAGCFSEDSHRSFIPVAPISAMAADANGKQPSVDWRDPERNPAKVNAVTPPKNQGAYGYCWVRKLSRGGELPIK